MTADAGRNDTDASGASSDTARPMSDNTGVRRRYPGTGAGTAAGTAGSCRTGSGSSGTAATLTPRTNSVTKMSMSRSGNEQRSVLETAKR